MKIKKIEEFESKNFFEINEFDKSYHCSIFLDNFCSLLAGHPWPIELEKDYMNKHPARMEKPSVKVAVFGFEKVGKSFLVRKISGVNVSHNRSNKKKGISALYSDDDSELSCTIMEMPGTNTSIKEGALEPSLETYFVNKGLLKEKRKDILYEDNILMENIVEEFLFQQAQVLLIVVNRIRREDQIFLERLKRYKEKKVIIIHNFIEAHNLNIAHEVIEEDIKSIFNTNEQKIFVIGAEEKENKIIYREKDQKRTEHVILAREGTEAGNFYNNSTINYLKQIISTTDCSEELDLITTFQTYLNTNLEKYIFPLDGAQGDIIELEMDNEKIPLGFKLKDFDRYPLKFKSVPQTSEAKQSVINDNRNNIGYSIRTLTNPENTEEKILQIELEVAGTCKDSDFKFRVDQLNDQAVIQVRGKNTDSVERMKNEEVLENTRRFGDFRLVTKPINIKGYTISTENRPEITSDISGLKLVTFKLLSALGTDDEGFY